jgi:hypothetical protein
MKNPKNADRRYWLWVTRPEYYRDEDGSPRGDLEPGNDVGDGWWTCHKDTKAGDLVLLYRASPMSDIAYLIRAESDAFPLSDDEYARDHGWAYGCEHQSLFQFQTPLTFSRIKAMRLSKTGLHLGAAFRAKPSPLHPTYGDALHNCCRKTTPASIPF